MKPYKFLVPIGVAAAALFGGGATVHVRPTDLNVEKPADASGEKPPFRQKYVSDGAEHTLVMRLSGERVLYAQHESHSSHDSHASHASHSSHQSAT